MRKLALFIGTPLLALSACANTSGNTSVACQGLTKTEATRPSGFSGSVFTVVMENHSRGQIIGSDDAPFINQLVKQNALAAGYHDSYVHPSEPNYLWMVSGENFGVLDDADPGSHHLDSTAHIADQIELAGLTWKTYQEGMGAPCGLTSHGGYAAKHNPFVYFDDINGWDGKAFQPSGRCSEHVVDYSQIDVDLQANQLPTYVFITPNLKDDMHDGSVADGDRWLARELPKILGSDAFNRGGVLFLLWDEGGGFPAGDDPPFIVISPNAKPGYVSKVSYDTSSYLKTVQNLLGLETLPCSGKAVDSVQAMDDLFTMTISPAATTPNAANTATTANPATTANAAAQPTPASTTSVSGTTTSAAQPITPAALGSMPGNPMASPVTATP